MYINLLLSRYLDLSKYSPIISPKVDPTLSLTYGGAGKFLYYFYILLPFTEYILEVKDEFAVKNRDTLP